MTHEHSYCTQIHTLYMYINTGTCTVRYNIIVTNDHQNVGTSVGE